MSFKVTPRLAREAIIGTQLDKAVASMMTDIHARSAELAPKDTRALVNSGRIIRKGSANYQVVYGSSKVPYARIHELGGVIKPKAGGVLAWKDEGSKYANEDGWVFAKSVKIKAKHYLRDGGDGVTRGDLSKYFRGLSV
jgi:hypothetical protein